MPAGRRILRRGAPAGQPAGYPLWWWAAAVLVPFAALAGRVLLHTRHVFLSGDLALIDLDVRRAATWHQLVGPYDRFGWSHPGPVYLYLISFVGRVTGQSRGLQAEVVTAVLINGLSLAGTILVTGRLLAGRPGAGRQEDADPGAATAGVTTAVAAAALAAMTIGIGTQAIFNPWNPYVVVLPLVLLGVLAIGAGRGSASCLAAAVVVATFAVQTDIGCLPWAAVLVVGAAAAHLLWRRRVGTAPVRPSTGVGVLVLATVLAWVPVAYQQVTGPHGNLAAIVSFFRHGPPRAGALAGGRAAGLALGQVIGLRPRMLPSHSAAGIVELSVALILLLALLRVSLRLGDRLAGTFHLVAAVGVVIAFLAGSAVVGPTYAYLLSWAAAATMVGGLGVALLLARLAVRPPGAARTSRPVVGASLAVVGLLLVRTTMIPDMGHYSDSGVAAAWRAIGPHVLEQPGSRVGLWFVSPQGWSVGSGLAAELAARSVPFSVLSRWSFQFGAGHHVRPARWVVLAAPGEPVPSSDRILARPGEGLRVALGPARP